jgi:NADH:ubiquinone oxidoreductase subunit 3 (subunit A)
MDCAAHEQANHRYFANARCGHRAWSAALAGTILFCVVAICHLIAIPRGMDFATFYSAAQMVRHGAGNQLYDVAAQRAFQLRFTGSKVLYYPYPPATALLYLPSTAWPLNSAYVQWTTLSVAILFISSVLLNLNYADTDLG